MNESKNIISDAQKAAQKKYDQKTKMVSIKYTPADMGEYERLKGYLDKTGQSVNSFIKKLINNFFESGQNRNIVEDIVRDPVKERSNRKEHYYPYSWIDDENIQFLYDNFGEEIMIKVLDEFYGIIDFELGDMLEHKGDNFDDWINDIKVRISDGEFQNENKEEISKELIKGLCNTV